MAQLLYQGHGSYRIIAKSGMVIYVDPFAGKGYDVPADLILITHEHFDHNKISLVAQKTDCRVIRASDALKEGIYQKFKVADASVEAVEAYNRYHKKEECVGYIITLDNVSIYAGGDTSTTEQMKDMKSRKLGWALLPIDGMFNMGPDDAAECAALIGAEHTIPIHMAPGRLFSKLRAESFNAPGRVIVKPGETISLSE